MNIQEFKAWFEGFNENLNGPPDTRQWARIVAQVCATSSVFNPSDAFRDLGRAEAASIRPKS